MERNSVFHQLHLVIFIIKHNAAFVKEIGTKNDVVTKICGVNNKGKVLIYNHVLVEFREPDFLYRAMSAVDVVVPTSKKICRSLFEEMGIKF